MKRKNIGCRHAMPVQPTYIIGTKNEDGTPDFAPITWVSQTYFDDEEPWLVISMWGNKKTKLNTQRTSQLTVNMVTPDMLQLTDYFGSVSAKAGEKNALPYAYSTAPFADAPTLDQSPWVCECKVMQSVKTGKSDTFFCKVLNVQIKEDFEVAEWGVDLTKLNPVVYSGHYQSVGEYLGTIGDFYK